MELLSSFENDMCNVNKIIQTVIIFMLYAMNIKPNESQTQYDNSS